MTVKMRPYLYVHSGIMIVSGPDPWAAGGGALGATALMGKDTTPLRFARYTVGLTPWRAPPRPEFSPPAAVAAAVGEEDLLRGLGGRPATGPKPGLVALT